MRSAVIYIVFLVLGFALSAPVPSYYYDPHASDSSSPPSSPPDSSPALSPHDGLVPHSGSNSQYGTPQTMLSMEPATLSLLQLHQLRNQLSQRFRSPSRQSSGASSPQRVPSSPPPFRLPSPPAHSWHQESGNSSPSGGRSPQQTPQGSPQQSPEGSPQQSPEGSPQQSPEGSPQQSPQQSPRQSSYFSTHYQFHH